MFSFNKKLDPNLRHSVDNKEFKNYRVLIHYKNLSNKIQNKINQYKGNILRTLPTINTFCAIVSPYTIERLVEHPEIDFITLDSTALLCANNQSIARANKISFKENYRLTGRGIGIGLIDTGVYPHNDLMNPYRKIVDFKDLLNNYKYPYDDNGHGTFICGLICGSGVSSEEELRGIAENSHIYCVKAFNKLGKGYISDILYAIQMILDDSETHNIKLLCLPFEILNNDSFILSLFSKMFNISNDKGLTVIVPAGHNGNMDNSIRGISTLSNCITVGGIDTTEYLQKPYIYSSSGPYKTLQKPDLAAACVNITSLNSDTNYESEKNGMRIYPMKLEKLYTCYTGTSCSTAYVCGLCALLLENNPNLKFQDILSLLKVSCELVNIPKNIQGAGVVNLDKLLP